MSGCFRFLGVVLGVMCIILGLNLIGTHTSNVSSEQSAYEGSYYSTYNYNSDYYNTIKEIEETNNASMNIAGIMLIIQGLFITLFSFIISKVYEDMIKIKNDNLKYIEDLVIYNKNLVKSINDKINEGDN